MKAINEIAQEWIKGASAAGDHEAVAVARAALSGDGEAQKEVLEMERQALASLGEWASSPRRERWDAASSV